MGATSARMSQKPLTTSCRAVDLRRWTREGWLIPQYELRWRWQHRDRSLTGAIRVRVGTDCLELVYGLPASPKPKIIRERVWIICSSVHHGGWRRWFRCPKCGRKAAILYLAHEYFVCRRCRGLAYASQYRSRGRVYGCQSRMLEASPPVPKGGRPMARAN